MRSTIIHTVEPAYKGHREERNLSINQSMHMSGLSPMWGRSPYILTARVVEKINAITQLIGIVCKIVCGAFPEPHHHTLYLQHSTTTDILSIIGMSP